MGHRCAEGEAGDGEDGGAFEDGLEDVFGAGAEGDADAEFTGSAGDGVGD